MSKLFYYKKLYEDMVNKLSDVNAEKMVLEFKIADLQTDLNFAKEKTELYHSKYQAYFHENRRLKHRINKLESIGTQTPTDMNVTSVALVDDNPTSSPDWRAPALGKRIVEDAVCEEGDNDQVDDLISDALPVDDSSSDNDDEGEPEVIANVESALAEIAPNEMWEDALAIMPPTTPQTNEISQWNELQETPTKSTAMSTIRPTTKSIGRVGNRRLFSNATSSIPARKQAKRFICRQESCERKNCIFKTLQAYRSHINTTHPMLKFLCDDCPYAATTKILLKSHETCHVVGFGKKAEFCQLCNASFSTGNRYTRHFNLYH